MSICGACYQSFDPDEYLNFYDRCGDQLTAQFDAMQEYRGEVLTMAQLSGRVMFGERELQQAAWRVG
jgi:hypothetical protein